MKHPFLAERNNPCRITIGLGLLELKSTIWPLGEEETVRLKFINETIMPIKIGSMTSDCEIETNGEVTENKK